MRIARFGDGYEQRVQFGKKQLAKITGTAMRESLSGRVFGSGSYAGSGLTLGGVGEEIYSEDDAIQKKISSKFQNSKIEVEGIDK